jgi:hypothetical protein
VALSCFFVSGHRRLSNWLAKQKAPGESPAMDCQQHWPHERKTAMTDRIEKKPFTVHMRRFFGFRPGDSCQEFAAELKTLSHRGRLAFAEMLNDAGYSCDAPTAASTAA